jgi:aryl carrier-like protein
MSLIAQPHVNMHDVFVSLKDLLKDINQDWEVETITPHTRLVDLGLESISLVYLIAELQQMYQLGDLLFRKMRSESSLLKDMTVGDILRSLTALVESKRKAV